MKSTFFLLGLFVFITIINFTISSKECTWPLLQSGDQNENVYSAQSLLNYRGYSTNGIDSIYGGGTVSAVKQFQADFGLGVDGKIGTNTWKNLVTDVKYKDNGYHVSGVQHSLHYKYLYSGVSVDGVYGSGTLDAVKDFQGSRNETQTGVVSQLTWLALLSGCNSTSSSTTPTSGKTVQEVINAGGCSTVAVAGISRQLANETNCLKPGLLMNLNNLKGPIYFSSAAAAVPYLQSAAANDLQKAIDQKGQKLGINSALRSIVQQLCLYSWYQQNKCGITAAAKPGHSNHNGASAVDIQNSADWRSTMENNNWSWQGAYDQMHYNYVNAVDIRSVSVLAFQKLYNLNNPNNKIDEDGLYGSGTEKAILSSPADGFKLTSTC